MTAYYMDTDGGSDASDGTTWANGKLTLEGLLAVMAAGDTGYIQGAASDTAATNRTFTSPGTNINPCVITGVVDGTTNEPPTATDIAVTLPIITNSVSTSDFTFGGSTDYVNLHFICQDRATYATTVSVNRFINSQYAFGDFHTFRADGIIEFINTVIEPTGTAALFAVTGICRISGGSLLATASADFVRLNSDGSIELKGFDLTALGTNDFLGSTASSLSVKMQNCKLPAVFTWITSAPVELGTSIEMIGCSDTTSVTATDSIQDYYYEDIFGTIDLEVTAVRTGGADDDATGLFSYAMTPAASATLESSSATLKSPWISVWIDGGANTLTVYIANDSASTDYNQDEVWVEFYTPDVGDTAQYDQTFDPAAARLFASSTAITDDTGSTWGTGANNHQQLSVTVTTGYTGWAYARLHLAKRSATPDTLYLDPRIAVT